MSKDKPAEKKARAKGAGRKPTPKLSESALDIAKEVLCIIAPHVPVKAIDDITLVEAIINYAYEQALILKNNIEVLKAQQGQYPDNG